jgi:uncharacterized protein (TIGR00297 family)
MGFEPRVFPEVWLAFGLSGLLAFGAYVRRSLTLDGALAAVAVGGLVWMGLGRTGFVVLCTFFLTSTLLGKVAKKQKREFESRYSKGHRRDAFQVIANGGVAACCGGILWYQSHGAAAVSANALATAIGVAGCASLASATGDTWATELGVLSLRDPWHLSTLRRVPRGTSGAVSGLGILVSGLGASTIALTAWILDPRLGLNAALTIAMAGFAGSALDSILGATLQRQYECSRCGATVETKRHCDHPTRLDETRWAMLDNDAVNLVANLSAGVMAGVSVVG